MTLLSGQQNNYRIFHIPVNTFYALFAIYIFEEYVTEILSTDSHVSRLSQENSFLSTNNKRKEDQIKTSLEPLLHRIEIECNGHYHFIRTER